MFSNEFGKKRIKNHLKKFVEHPGFQNFILSVIIINSLLLGIMTYPAVMEKSGNILELISIFVSVFLRLKLL